MNSVSRMSPIGPGILLLVGGCLAGCLCLVGCSSHRSSDPVRSANQTPDGPSGLDREAGGGVAAAEPRRLSLEPARIEPIMAGAAGFPDIVTKPRPFRLARLFGGSSGSVLSGPEMSAPGIVPIEFPSERSASAVEIRETLQDYLAAFNRHDDAALASYWSETAENIDLDSGRRVDGRQAVREVFSALFSRDAAASIDFDIESIRPVAEDVAVVDGISQMSFSEGADARSRFSAVVVRQDGHWRIESVREAAAPGPVATSPRPLVPLGWLLGEWEGIEPGKPAAMECHWSAGRSFLVRSHRVQEQPALPSREITEIVGHDPVTGGLRSWIFSSNGSFGEAVWKNEGAGTASEADAVRWTLLVNGTLSDGRSVQGSVVLTRIGDDGLTCILAGDDLAELLPPENDYVRVARPSPGP